jgi:hypothetical protein
VGGIFEVVSASLTCFIFLAARFSFNVRPGFFALAFCGDLLDITAPSLVVADMLFRAEIRRKAAGVHPWFARSRGSHPGGVRPLLMDRRATEATSDAPDPTPVDRR